MKRLSMILTAFSLLSTHLVHADRTLSFDQIKKQMVCGGQKSGGHKFDNSGIKLIPLEKLIPTEKLKAMKEKKLAQKKDGFRSSNRAVDLKALLGVKETVDFSWRDTKIKNQNNSLWEGMCTTFGLVAIMENIINDPAEADVSENHFWNTYQEYSVDSALNSAMKNKITLESSWPQENQYPDNNYLDFASTKITGFNELGDDVNKAVQALDRGNLVYIGMTTSSSMYNGDQAIDPCSSPLDGGHALAIVGYHLDKDIMGGGYFIIKNSWGEKNGDHGYQYVPFNQCQRDDMYCFLYEITGVETKIKRDQNPKAPTTTPTDPTPTPNPAPNNNYPVGFDSSNIQLNSSLNKPWYSSYQRLVVSLDIPSSQMKYVQSVVYDVDDDSVAAVEVSDKSSNFSYKFKLKGDSFDITVTLKLVNGTEYSFTSTAE